MSERKTEVAVGLIVTAALLILVLGIIWGRDVDILSRRTFLIIHFNNVYGLEKSDPVLVRGMKQGEVDRIILKSEYVEVHLWIKQHVLLYSDMRVTIENRELVGGKQISIDPGRSGLAADLDKVYIGEVDGDLGLLLIKVGEVLADVDDVLGRLKVVFEPDHFEAVLQNVEEATIRVRELIAENR
ncbi:MlaD family protein, partial [bacterium]|nr:MlaD family protein [bacterium]